MRLSALVSLLVLSSCALRPLYKELAVAGTPDKETRLMVVDPVTNAALSGLKIEMSEGKNRYATTSSADGSFALPLEKKYFDENPYLVVTGVMPNGYKVVPVPKPVVVEAPVTPQNDVGSADAGTGGNMEPAAPVKAP